MKQRIYLEDENSRNLLGEGNTNDVGNLKDQEASNNDSVEQSSLQPIDHV